MTSKQRLHEGVASGEFVRVSSKMLGEMSVPSSFDSATNWPHCAKVINDIRDQSACGCCWAFGAAEAASDRMCIATNASMAFPLSAQDVCFCGSDSGCDGGMLPDAWQYIQDSGVVTGAQQEPEKANDDPFQGGGFCSKFSLPHCHHHGPMNTSAGPDPYPAENTQGCPTVKQSPACPSKCDADAKPPHDKFGSDKYTFGGKIATYEDEEAIQKAIMTEGPVEAAFTVMSDFENYHGGVYVNKKGHELGGHAIRIVGWGTNPKGTKYWRVANSWNRFWGENGYFRIRRGTNECGIEEQVIAGSGKWEKASVSPPGPPAPPGSCPIHDDQKSCRAAGGCSWCRALPPVSGGFCFQTPCP